MKILGQALQWLSDPQVWGGVEGLWTRIGQHLGISALTVLLAAVIAWPLGVWIGHTGRGAGVVGALTGAARALPTLGLLTLFGLLLGIGLGAPVVALVILAIPSLLAGAHAGVSAVDRTVIDAARSIGMSTHQLVWEVEIPLAAPVIVGGVRAAMLQVISTTTLAAYTADVGLGRYLFSGLKTKNYAMMMGASLVVVVLTVLADLGFSVVQRWLTRRTHQLSRCPVGEY